MLFLTFYVGYSLLFFTTLEAARLPAVFSSYVVQSVVPQLSHHRFALS